MKFRKIGFISLPALACVLLTGCGTETYVVPTFDEGKQIQLIAYAPSCPTGLLGGNVSTITEENYKNIAKAGFTHTLSLYEGFFTKDINLKSSLERSYKTTNEQNLQILDYCEKYGLKHYARDWAAYMMGIYAGYDNPLEKYRSQLSSYDQYKEAFEVLFPESTDPEERQYFKHPAYAGNYLADEPFFSSLKTLGEITDIYLNRMDELGVKNVNPIVNLLPCHAGGTSLGPGWSEYVDSYYAYTGKKIGSISYDFYPFMKGKKDSSYMKDLYLYNLQTAAEKCKDYGCNLETYVQTKGDFTGMRDLTSIGDIRMQLYTDLAFGSSKVTYYEYGCKNGEAEGNYALLNLTNGELTKNYAYVKECNNEIKSFEKIVSCFEYDDIMCKLGDPDIPNLNFELLENNRGNVSSNDRVSIASCTQDVFMTSMKRKTDRSDAFMLVNFTDPFYKLNNTVTLNFKNTKALLVYKMGERQILESPSGSYTFELEPGEGTFIVPLN
ncbi:MAG: hypothetical protein MJ239_03535 [Bacilli bacterium]|nr:hypothetical protein [Bacilli bacterium]